MEKEVNVEKYVIFLLSTLSFGLVILFLFRQISVTASL